MYVFFVVQAVLTALHAAVAQAPVFQLVCPGAGLKENNVYTLNCTVRGLDVATAACIAPVSSVKLETVNAVGKKFLAYSIFPTCETSWSHSGNASGRCVAKDNNDIYYYEFNVTAIRAIFTNDTGLRCYADCSTGPGSDNPFSFNTSESCGPPVKFADNKDTGGLTTEEKAGIGELPEWSMSSIADDSFSAHIPLRMYPRKSPNIDKPTDVYTEKTRDYRMFGITSICQDLYDVTYPACLRIFYVRKSDFC